MISEAVEVKDAVNCGNSFSVKLAVRQHGEIRWWPEKHKGIKDF